MSSRQGVWGAAPPRAWVVLADDLTGALDTGVRLGPALVTVSPGVPAGDLPPVLVVNTATRHLPPEEAGRVAAAQAAAAPPGTLVFKKTDSCLRGHVGAELEAVMRARGAGVLPFVPAFPELGRTTRGGVQYVDGRPVHETAMASDPLDPVTDSYLPAILARETRVPVRVVPAGAPIPSGGGILVFDCETGAEMAAVAARLRAAGPWRVAAGCAGLAGALMGAGPRPLSTAGAAVDRYRGRPLLVAAGSPHPVSVEQVREAARRGAPGFAVSAAEAVDPAWPSTPRAAALAGEAARALAAAGVCVLGTGRSMGRGEGADAGDAGGGRPCEGLGRLAALVTARAGCPVNLAVFGGDTLLSVMEALGRTTLTPLAEICPGVVAAEAAGTLVVAKAGSFGPRDLVEVVMAALRADGPAGRRADAEPGGALRG